MREKDPHRYDDMLDMTRPVNPKHPPMALSDRAAQFSPFAALTGYDDLIEETGRWTEKRPEISEDKKEELDRKLSALEQRLPAEISLRYFLPDAKKDGGMLMKFTGRLAGIYRQKKELRFEDGTSIPLSDVVDMERAE